MILLSFVIIFILFFRYELDYLEYQRFKDIKKEQKKFVATVVASKYNPSMKLILEKNLDLLNSCIEKFLGVIKEKYISHLDDYQFDRIRDFTDALIFAKEDSLKNELENEKESAPYLSKGNMIMALSDLFLVGYDTTQLTLKWIILLMANYPEMQRKMRNEIKEQIGDRIPVQNDKRNCDYVNAFISETLRYRIVVPMGVPHKAIYDVKIGKLIVII